MRTLNLTFSRRVCCMEFKLYMSLKFRIGFWDVLPCKIIVDRCYRGTCCLHQQGWWSLIPDDGGSTYLWNVGRQLFYTAVHPRNQFWTSYSQPWELEISHLYELTDRKVCNPTQCHFPHLLYIVILTALTFMERSMRWGNCCDWKVRERVTGCCCDVFAEDNENLFLVNEAALRPTLSYFHINSFAGT
jgi:hypothetical protein